MALVIESFFRRFEAKVTNSEGGLRQLTKREEVATGYTAFSFFVCSIPRPEDRQFPPCALGQSQAMGHRQAGNPHARVALRGFWNFILVAAGGHETSASEPGVRTTSLRVGDRACLWGSAEQQ